MKIALYTKFIVTDILGCLLCPRDAGSLAAGTPGALLEQWPRGRNRASRNDTL